MNARRWLPLSDTTVYLTVKTLARAGRTALREALGAFLARGDAPGSEFGIASLLVCHVDRGEAARILSERQSRLTAQIEATADFLAEIDARKRRDCLVARDVDASV